MEKEPITLNGLNNLKEELIFLKEKKRPEIVAAIAEARSHGDLKENAEYHAAKEEQSHSEGRITEISDIIARANVIDVTKLNNDGKVIFGSTVSLENLDKMLAEIIASFEKATAVGPLNKFARSLHFVFSRANLVILFLVILNCIPCSLIWLLNSSS